MNTFGFPPMTRELPWRHKNVSFKKLICVFIETKYYLGGAIIHDRPEKLAKDDTPSIDAIKEFLEVQTTIQDFALFQCTSVFLKSIYIQEAVQKFKSHDCVFAAKRYDLE